MNEAFSEGVLVVSPLTTMFITAAAHVIVATEKGVLDATTDTVIVRGVFLGNASLPGLGHDIDRVVCSDTRGWESLFVFATVVLGVQAVVV
jgi:hypothetical protein